MQVRGSSKNFIVPPHASNKSSIMGTASREKASTKAADLLVRKIYAYRDDNARDMRRLLKLWNKLNSFTETEIKNFIYSCSVCIQSGEPLLSRKVFIKHIDKDFNQTIVVEFFYFEHGTPVRTHMFLDSRCTGTGYSETSPVESRDMKLPAATFDHIWI